MPRKNIRKYPCGICKKVFTRSYHLNNHKKIKHMRFVEKIVCPLWPSCKNRLNVNGLYSNKSNLKVHFRRHHQNKKNTEKKIKNIIHNAKKVWIDKGKQQ